MPKREWTNDWVEEKFEADRGSRRNTFDSSDARKRKGNQNTGRSDREENPNKSKEAKLKAANNTEEKQPTTFIKNPNTGQYTTLDAKKEQENNSESQSPDQQEARARKHKQIRKILKISCVIACFIGMFVHVALNFVEYGKYETTSQISPWVPPAYPDALYCGSNYLDFAKAEALGFSKEDTYFYDSYTAFGSVNYAMARLGQTSYGMEATINPNYTAGLVFSAESRITKLEEFIAGKDMTFDQLFKQISKDPEDMVTGTIDMVADVIQVKPENRWTMYGMCKLMRFSEHSMNVFKSSYMRAQIYPHNQSWVDTYLLFFGTDAQSIMPSFKTDILSYESYTVGLVVTNVRRVSTKFKRCNVWTEAERSRCIAECVNNYVCATTCRQAIADDIVEPRTFCNLFYGLYLGDQELCAEKQLNATDEEIDHCYNSDNCPMACDEQRFQISVAIRDSSETVYISLGYNDPKQQQEIVQTLAIPLNTLLSNLGGSISLWSGVSILLVINYFIDGIAERSLKS